MPGYVSKFFWPHRVAYGLLVPRPGIEPGALAVRPPSPNHWTAREFLNFYFLRIHSGPGT